VDRGCQDGISMNLKQSANEPAFVHWVACLWRAGTRAQSRCSAMQRHHNGNPGGTAQGEKATNRVPRAPIVVRPRFSCGSRIAKRKRKSGSSVARDATKEMRTTPKARRDVCSLSNVGASRTAKLIGHSDRLDLTLDSRRDHARDRGGTAAVVRASDLNVFTDTNFTCR
jgi:hypothetical protein